MPKFISVFLILGVVATTGCGDTVCAEANDLCSPTPDAPSFATERDRCVGDDLCVGHCLVEANACEPDAVSTCEARCEGSAGGGAP